MVFIKAAVMWSLPSSASRSHQRHQRIVINILVAWSMTVTIRTRISLYPNFSLVAREVAQSDNMSVTAMYVPPSRIVGGSPRIAGGSPEDCRRIVGGESSEDCRRIVGGSPEESRPRRVARESPEESRVTGGSTEDHERVAGGESSEDRRRIVG
jgi:hypothetical protein